MGNWAQVATLVILSAAACGDDLDDHDHDMSPQRTAADAASADAGCLECLPKVDSGLARRAENDAGKREPKPCIMQEAPCASVPCAWTDAQKKLPACATPPLTPFYAARCGEYDAYVRQGTDSILYYLYDANGRLIGSREDGFGAGCSSFDDSFRLPQGRCMMVTPKCPKAEDAGI